MFALKGRNWRCVDETMPLQDGEILVDELPAELLTQTASERNEEIRMGIGRWIDEVARGNGYDNAVSCASYVSSAIPKHKTEAMAVVAWRDAVWSAAYDLLKSPPAGVSTLPQVIELLPKPEQFGWAADPIELAQTPPPLESA